MSTSSNSPLDERAFEAFEHAQAEILKNQKLCRTGDAVPATVAYIDEAGRASLTNVSPTPLQLAACLRYEVPFTIIRRRPAAVAVAFTMSVELDGRGVSSMPHLVLTAAQASDGGEGHLYQLAEAGVPIGHVTSGQRDLTCAFQDYLALADDVVPDVGLEVPLASVLTTTSSEQLEAVAGAEARARVELALASNPDLFPWRVRQAFPFTVLRGKRREAVLRALDVERRAVMRAVTDTRVTA